MMAFSDYMVDPSECKLDGHSLRVVYTPFVGSIDATPAE